MTDRHDHYRELCAEDAAGRLSESEWAELQEHLSTCEACRKLSRDFVRFSLEVIPRVGELYGAKRQVNPARKQRLLELARAEGLSYSAPSGKKLVVTQRAFGKSALFIAWATSLIAAVVVTLIISKHYLNQNVGRTPAPLVTNRTTVPLQASKPNMPSAAVEREENETTERAHPQNVIEAQRRQLKEWHRLKAAVRSERDLLTARNLHVFDVFPVDEKGNRAREFGRVFFAQDKKLAFYAFDLSEPTNNRRNHYYVWAERRKTGPENSSQIVPLGKLAIDSSKDNRWSLIVSDPIALTGVRAVFVTVESSIHQTAAPTGTKMLYTSLDSRPSLPH